ncbi:MAG TPA: fumarylacetoacetate hydrolase family protein [Terriglobales bacterium]|nr:fumarylacetoacetate hydrolase family protein [Terriglobales bacterium]
MKYCRFSHQGASRYGLIETVGGVERITQAQAGPPFGPRTFDGAQKCDLAIEAVRLLAPAEPTKIVCIGRNYREHAKELNHAIPTEPLFFLKPPSSVIAPGEEIRRPIDLSQRVDHEGELAVVIGKRCYRLGDSEDVRPYIVGYSCLNDVTARDLQNKDGQWSRAKGFDTFCPIGPAVVAGLDPWKGVGVQTRVNGELRQDGTTADFLFPLDVLVRFITQVMTLEAGDVIATGTPAGVSPLNAGDVVEISVEGVGTLRNPVVDR